MFQKTTLPNGLRVITAPMPAAKSVAVMVMLAAGSRYETKPTNGIAHFAEHMFFKGTEKRPTAKDISAEVDGIGGEFNAFTGKEYTGYYIKCAAEHRALALDVLADQLLASQIRPRGDRAREGRDHRGAEHVRRHAPRPRRQRLRPAAVRRPAAGLGHHRHQGDDPRGRPPDLPRLSGRWYTPRRMVVGAAGAVDGEFVAEVERQFGHLADRATGDAPPVEVVQAEPRVRLETRDSDQAHLRLGVRGIPTDSPDRYAMQVLTAILGGGMSSRLFTEVRERLGLAYYVYGYHQSYADTGHAVLAGRRRHRADRPGRVDDRGRVPQDGRRAGAR